MGIQEPKLYPDPGYGLMAVDWQERINFPQLRQQRNERTRQVIKQNGMAGALLTKSNLRYSTAIRTPLYTAGIGSEVAVVTVDDPDPIVFISGLLAVHYRKHCPWIKPENIRAGQMIPPAGSAGVMPVMKQYAALIFEALKERKIEKEKIGADGIHPIIEAELKSKGVHIEPVSGIMTKARSIKFPDEIKCLTMAAIIADTTWYELFQFLKPGITEHQLSAHGMEILFRYGAEGPCLVSVRSGPNSAPNLGGIITDRMMRVGDLGFADIWGNLYNGYNTCYYRSWKLGERPAQKEMDWYKKAYDQLLRTMDAIKPGATTADVAKKLPTAKDYGVASEWELTETRLCHGIGLTLHDLPFIHPVFSLENPEPIEEGMVIAVETWWGENFVGGCRIEVAGVVTASGFEVLYRTPYNEPLQPTHSYEIK